MKRRLPWLFLSSLASSFVLCAEVRTLSLPEAVDVAAKSNPDIIIARLEAQKAAHNVTVARDPFSPRVIVGSGLAWTSGFPMSIEGSAPSIFQARVVQSIYNKPRSYEVAAARENARAAGLDVDSKREEVAHRVAMLYLDIEQLTRNLESARQSGASAEKIAETIRARVEAGRALPMESRRVELNVARIAQRTAELEADLEMAEASLAITLGYPAEDRVRVVTRERPIGPAMGTEQESVANALASSHELKRLEAAMQVRGLELRSARSARLPQVDLLAQYALFSRFNNYEDFFNRFERHNGQIGVSLALPILPGSGAKGRAAQAETELTRLRAQVNAVRDRVTLDTRKAYREIQRATTARDVARLDLDVTRDQLNVLLAQFEEGRATLAQVEELRTLEAEKWLAFYTSQNAIERAQIELLRQTGSLLAALR